MKATLAFALVAGLTLSTSALAQTVIVQDNFDQYANTAAFQAAWVPTTGLGTADALAADVDAGVLTSDPLSNPDLFPGLQGQAVDHVGASASAPGMVNQWGGVIDQTSGKNPVFSIAPTTTDSVFLKADIFVGSSGNERMTVGLRHTTALADDTIQPPDADSFPDANTANIFEMGVYNANPTVTIEGLPTVTTGYAFRIINFGPVSAPLTAQPNWQYFPLPQGLDRTTDTDELVTIGDVGAGWHTYTATFTETEITVTIDLFRDGFVNVRDEAGTIVIGSGVAGVDASVTLPVATQVAGFNNLRIGGPSGLLSGGTGAMGFDNILLQTQTSAGPTEDADFDGDGDVDGADFLTWQRGLGLTGQTDNANGDANLDGTIDAADLGVWKTQFAAAAAGASVAAVPEPATVLLALAGMAAACGLSRRRA